MSIIVTSSRAWRRQGFDGSHFTLRHSYASHLIQAGASLTYVKEQMGHGSIQVTVDTYGHLVPGADIGWVDKLDAATNAQPSATQEQPDENTPSADVLQLIENVGGPARIRTLDQRIMSGRNYIRLYTSILLLSASGAGSEKLP